MITLVPFYKEIIPGKESQAVCDMTTSFDYKKSLRYLNESFSKFNPNYKFEVATDLTTVLPFENIFRSDLSNMNLMESLTVSNTEYVINHTGKIVLCGVDHLICNTVDGFFHNNEFDIGLFVNGGTINNTVVLVNKQKDNSNDIDNFFKTRLDIFQTFDTDTKNWFGDQKSYSVLLGNEKIIHRYLENKNQNIYDFMNLKIKLFDYGYLVKGCRKGGGLKGSIDKMILIDFKGTERKKHIDTMFNFVMQNGKS